MASSTINDWKRIRERITECSKSVEDLDKIEWGAEYSESVKDLDKTEWIAEYSESFKDQGRRKGFVQCSEDLLTGDGEFPKTILVGKESYLTN
jgi:hypothetical protein